MLLASSAFVVSCATAPAPVAGSLFSSVKYDGPIGDPSAATSKTGTACATSILGAIASGDASITAAKADGAIKKVGHVDHTGSNFSTTYARYCTVVKGE